MRINPTLRNIIELAYQGGDWQTFVERSAERFDAAGVEGFEFAPVTLSYTWAQLIKNVGATVLPTYVDPESEGFEMPLQEMSGSVGSIPTQKLYYSVNRVVVREQMQLAQKFGQLALNDEMGDIMFDLLDEGTKNLVQSFINALNHQRHQIVSTGKFSIDATNNPRGYKGVEIGFNIPADHFETLAGTSRWWTNADHTTANEGSKSDPVGYLKNRVKSIRRAARFPYSGPLRLELTQDLLDDLLTHTAVLKTLGYRIVPTAASDTIALNVAMNSGDDRLVDELRRTIRVDEITARETYAYVSKPGKDTDGKPDLVTERIDNFKKENIALVPTGQLGTIQGVQPLSMGHDADKVAYAMGNRLLIEQEDIPRSHSLNINGEMGQLCVPSVINQMYISTVTV